MASRYRWWETPHEALSSPHHILAAVMNTGTIDDIFLLKDLFEKTELSKILQDAVIGQFTEKSWHYWHYCLTDVEIGGVPPLPVDRIPLAIG